MRVFGWDQSLPVHAQNHRNFTVGFCWGHIAIYLATNDWKQVYHMKKWQDVPVDKILLFAVGFTFLGQWQGELKGHNHKGPFANPIVWSGLIIFFLILGNFFWGPIFLSEFTLSPESQITKAFPRELAHCCLPLTTDSIKMEAFFFFFWEASLEKLQFSSPCVNILTSSQKPT